MACEVGVQALNLLSAAIRDWKYPWGGSTTDEQDGNRNAVDEFF